MWCIMVVCLSHLYELDECGQFFVVCWEEEFEFLVWRLDSLDGHSLDVCKGITCLIAFSLNKKVHKWITMKDEAVHILFGFGSKRKQKSKYFLSFFSSSQLCNNKCWRNFVFLQQIKQVGTINIICMYVELDLERDAKLDYL